MDIREKKEQDLQVNTSATLVESEKKVIIEAKNLGLYYPKLKKRSLFKRLYGKGGLDKGFWALRNLNFKVYEGEVVGVVGRNGAGKSTLSLVLSRIFEPDEGEVMINGKVSALLSLGGMFQQNMTGRDNTFYFGAFLGFSRSDIESMIPEIIDFSELGDFFDEPVATYSSGMKSRLAFSIASSIRPEILILDEILSVGDREFRQKCEDRLAGMMGSCKCIVLISHNLNSIKKMCKSCIWINKGSIHMIGDSETVLTQYKETIASNREARKNL